MREVKVKQDREAPRGIDSENRSETMGAAAECGSVEDTVGSLQ